MFQNIFVVLSSDTDGFNMAMAFPTENEAIKICDFFQSHQVNIYFIQK